MENIFENARMTLVLEGRIDSNNAASVEKDVMHAVKKASGKDIVIDVRALEYISSAGLRVLMNLRKHQVFLLICCLQLAKMNIKGTVISREITVLKQSKKHQSQVQARLFPLPYG